METEPENISDQDLIRQCQLGDKPAFEKLVRRYYQKAYSIALMKMHDPDAALDISREAFIRVFRSIKRFDSEKSFSPWLYTYAHQKHRCKRCWIKFASSLHTHYTLLPSHLYSLIFVLSPFAFCLLRPDGKIPICKQGCLCIFRDLLFT